MKTKISFFFVPEAFAKLSPRQYFLRFENIQNFACKLPKLSGLSDEGSENETTTSFCQVILSSAKAGIFQIPLFTLKLIIS